MKSAFLIATSATALILTTSLGAAQAPLQAAQAPVQKESPVPTRTVNLTLEQVHVIKEFVKDLKVDQTPGNFEVAVGATIPDQVALHDLPAEVGQKIPQVKSHKFFVTQTKIVLVDPKDKRISEVIE